ncbi:MAG: hypothetical protein AAB668_03310 [Patescibacteria group bacterium]
MSPEVVRGLVGGLICAALLLAFGFLPVWIGERSAWAASNQSTVAMPVGESKTSEVRAPFDLKKPVSSFSEPSSRF